MGGGLPGADDGGAVAVEVGPAVGLPGAAVLAVAVAVAVVVGAGVLLAGAAELLAGAAVVPGVVELPVGAGAGGPKQPVSVNRAHSPRTLTAVCLGEPMLPPLGAGPLTTDPP